WCWRRGPSPGNPGGRAVRPARGGCISAGQVVSVGGPTIGPVSVKHPPFRVHSEFAPAGDQPQAIAGLAQGVQRGDRYQTLLGVTGTGKTFTMAGVIEKVQKPTLVIAPNKSLAAQLANELLEFFPENA